MSAAQHIRAAVAHVSTLRSACAHQPALHQALAEVKDFQSRRFAGCYADLLASECHGAAARFFLDELYGVRDYAQRDAQFARVAGALERLFPKAVVQTAVRMAQLHQLTEDLDLAMARHWLGETACNDVCRYARAWRAVGRDADRRTQLTTVLDVGEEMQCLTRKAGLRPLLRMMRAPASAAGLAALQRFLEAGFDTFAAMARQREGARTFLTIIAQRESALLDLLGQGDVVACETTLARLLGQAR